MLKLLVKYSLNVASTSVPEHTMRSDFGGNWKLHKVVSILTVKVK